jgi:hypothetical protein
VLLLMSRAASAEPVAPTDPVRSFEASCEFELEYDAPSNCESRAQFEQDVYARARPAEVSPTTTPTGHDVDCRLARVHVRVSDDGRSGLVEVRDSAAHEVVRNVVGADCREVLHAVALIVGLSLTSQELTPSNGPPPKPVAQPEPRRRPARVSPEARRATPAPSARPPRPRSSASSLPRQHAAALAWAFGGRFSLLETVAPRPAPAVGAMASVYLRSTSLGSSRARLAVGRTLTQTMEQGDNSAHIGLTFAELEACPFAWPRVSPWALRPCLSIEAGLLEANGDRVNGVRKPATLLWGSTSATLSTEVLPVRFFGLEAEGGLILPWIRDEFRLPGGSSALHKVPSVGWSAALGVSVFPAGYDL